MKLKQNNIYLLIVAIMTAIILLMPVSANAQSPGTITLSYAKVNETNAVITIQTSNITKVRMPDGNWSTQSNFTYSVSENGTYDFEGQTFGADATQKSIVINDLRQDFSITKDPNVTLKLNVDDTLSGVTQMRFSNDNTTWSTYEPVGLTKNWVLPLGDGLKNVYVQHMDLAGNSSSPRSDKVYLDQTPPTVGFKINNGNLYTNNKNVALTFNITDVISAVSTISVSNDNVNWTTFPLVSSKSWVIPGTIGNNKIYVKATDTSGNISSPVIQQIYYDNVLPTGSILINNGDTATNSRDVTLSVNFADIHSGVAKVRVLEGSNAYQFPTVPSSPTTLPWTLNLGQTGKVSLEITDKAGNVFTVNSNTINIITLKITGFKLNNVINPLSFNFTTPYISKSWTFPPQPMLAGANISFEIDYDLYDQGSVSSTSNAIYTIEIIGANGYNKKIIAEPYTDKITVPTKGFASIYTLPLDAPTNAKVYLTSTVSATVATVYSSVTQYSHFPGPDASTTAQIGYVQGNIQQSLKFNELK